MPWLRLTLDCKEEFVEPLSQLFEQFSAIAVSHEAISDEKLYAGVAADPVYWHKTAVSALFDDSIDMDILLACARNRIGTENLLGNQIEAVKDNNWLEAHKADHGELVFNNKLCIHPQWVEPERDYSHKLVLEPGLAFGSGRHDTTSLCLDWLARTDLQGQNLIDYGCGSGILALSAALLGASHVTAIDIDPQALEASRSNAEVNSLTDALTILDAETPDLPEVDILMANILLNPLLDLAEKISRLVREDGHLILSGVLSVQAEECAAAYSPWFIMNEPVFLNEWARLEGRRRA
ncbi:MAG: 50S ribosomal protein L11 methyltransferase [Gammaproteobacteria bacterium]|nr:50S ribosomal protein L11 methyltransferase [Gammaproteobacteria bacterium]